MNNIRVQSLAYLLIPFLFFCVGFLKWYVALFLIALTFYATYTYVRSCHIDVAQQEKNGVFDKNSFIRAGGALIIAYFLGIGGYWTQSSDWCAKNPILNDLSNYPWPLIVNPTVNSGEFVQMVDSGPVSFVYYLFYYLPAAAVGQLCGIKWARFAFLLWSAWGIFILLSLLQKTIIKDSNRTKALLLGICFFSFGGLDIVGHCLRLLHYWDPNIPLGEQRLYATWLIDQWCRPYFAYYASNWTSLYWCFNQCIPVWIIVTLILMESDIKTMGFLFSITLLYSPWCTMGLLPIVLYYIVRVLQKDPIRYVQLFNVHNIVSPLCLLLVVGSFYMSNETPLAEKGWFWNFLSPLDFIPLYLVFILLELGVYIWLLRTVIKKNYWLQGAMMMLFVIPFYKMTFWNDWLMRASIPSLFIVFIFWIKWIVDNWNVKKQIIILVVFICSFSSIQLVMDSAVSTFDNKGPLTYYQDESFVCTENSSLVKMGEAQFYAHNYKKTFFWKYFAK